MTIIEQIKAEIKNALHILGPGYSEMEMGQISAYGHILSILSTLESEKPMNQDELEKEIEKYFPESAFNTGFNYDDIQDIARHFAQWGAKWQKEQYHFFNKAWAENMQTELDRNYENGKQAMKEQMMKEAVEGKIIFLLNGDVAVNIGDTDKYNLGQKIRVIVLPKEDEKWPMQKS